MSEPEHEEARKAPHVVSADSARFASKIFNYGNIVAMILPLPLGIFWMGASMLVYAMNRHNPNPRVGYYTQRAATRLYALIGVVVVVANFFSGVAPWLVTWAICAAFIVPLSIIDLVRIQRETWHDTEVPAHH